MKFFCVVGTTITTLATAVFLLCAIWWAHTVFTTTNWHSSNAGHFAFLFVCLLLCGSAGLGLHWGIYLTEESSNDFQEPSGDQPEPH